MTQDSQIITAYLKPCPFCGGEAAVRTYLDESLWSHNIVKKTQVGCDNCDYSFATEPGYEIEALELWNTRVSLPSPPVSGGAWRWEEQGGKTNEWRVYLGPHCFGGVWGWNGTYGAETYLLHALPNDEKYSGSLDSAKAKLTAHLDKILSACGLLSPLTNEPVGQFDTSDYIIVGSDGKPRRNEPVGVTISRELAEDIREALKDLGACPDDECTQCKRVLPRLSASITGEKE